MKSNIFDTELISLPISEVRPYAKNPRKNEKAIDHVARSIKRYGFQSPIIVDRENVIVCGHTRYYAAQKIPLDSVPCRRARINGRDLSEAECRGLRIADNKTSEYANWDYEFLATELKDLEAGLPEEDLEDLTALSEAEIRKIMRGLEGDEAETPDAKIPVETDITLGDVFTLGDHRLLCGDSLDEKAVGLFLGEVRPKLCFTDPPYGVEYSGGVQFNNHLGASRGMTGGNTGGRERLAGDDINVYPEAVKVISRYVDGAVYMFFARHGKNVPSLYNAIWEAGAEIRSQLIFIKGGGYAAMNAQYKPKHEPFLYWIPKGRSARWKGLSTETTIFEAFVPRDSKFHPTQKPVEIIERALANHEARTVFDPFAGGGSTLIACEKSERSCLAIEINPLYCQTIINRWEEYTGRTAVKDGSLAISEAAAV